MAVIIRMPEVLAGAAEATIQSWLVEPGASVDVDQTLAEIETEKAIVELQAESAGVIGRLLVGEGRSVAVGDPILALVAPGEGDTEINAALAASGITSSGPGAGSVTVEPVRHTAAALAVDPAGPPTVNRRRFVSPLVRRLASDHGVDVADIVGSGPNGRVVRRDLERHLESLREPVRASTAAVAHDTGGSVPTTEGTSYDDVPLNGMRRAIARRLTESTSTVPDFFLVADCRVDALLALRAQINEGATKRVSVNDFVIKAVAGALLDVPLANVIWNSDSVRRFGSADIGVAIATDGGLVTPVLRAVERMPLSEVSSAVLDLAERARAGRLRQHELEGGSFAVSNLGMYGTKQFGAIINPPQSGILAVGAAQRRPVVDADGAIGVGTAMTVTLSADHRVLDGALAAQWLDAFQRRIEHPLSILI